MQGLKEDSSKNKFTPKASTAVEGNNVKISNCNLEEIIKIKDKEIEEKSNYIISLEETIIAQSKVLCLNLARTKNQFEIIEKIKNENEILIQLVNKDTKNIAKPLEKIEVAPGIERKNESIGDKLKKNIIKQLEEFQNNLSNYKEISIEYDKNLKKQLDSIQKDITNYTKGLMEFEKNISLQNNSLSYKKELIEFEDIIGIQMRNIRKNLMCYIQGTLELQENITLSLEEIRHTLPNYSYTTPK